MTIVSLNTDVYQTMGEQKLISYLYMMQKVVIAGSQGIALTSYEHTKPTAVASSFLLFVLSDK